VLSGVNEILHPDLTTWRLAIAGGVTQPNQGTHLPCARHVLCAGNRARSRLFARLR